MKRAIIAALMMIIFILSISACANQNDRDPKVSGNNIKNEFKNISPADAKKRLDSETGIILLDVRTQEEYDEIHIPKSILIPVEVIDKEAQTILKDKDAPVFVYCRSGRRSVIAAESLVRQGYTNVFNLGGINEWTYETKSGKTK